MSDNIFMAKTEQITMRLPKDLLELLDFIANRDLRTRSNLIEFILINWLREHEPNEFNDDGNILSDSDTFAPVQ